MSKVTALTVQTLTRPTTVQSAAPGQAKKAEADATPAVPVVAAPAPAPAAPIVAAPTMAALIQVQAEGPGKGHVDPQPTHGHDDEHGHAPPPVVQPPVVQPPVVQPPVVQPPVVEPPEPAPRPVQIDPAAAGRSLAMLVQSQAELATIREAGAAFANLAAERQAFRVVTQDSAAISLLQVLQGDMSAFNGGWSAHAFRH